MAPIRSKLMELSYSDPKFQIRLTGYADTVIIDSGAQQTISAIRFGGYPEVVRALSDAIYGGASVELKQGDTILYLECRLKGYRRLLSHDGIYAVATLMANDDSQTEENTADDSEENAPENPRKCYIFSIPVFAGSAQKRCGYAHRCGAEVQRAHPRPCCPAGRLSHAEEYLRGSQPTRL